MADYDITKFCDKPCSITYGGTLLGGTDGPVKIQREDKTIEVTCNQAQGGTVAERIVEITMTVSAKFKEISTALGLLLGTAKTITGAEIGTDVMAASNRKTLVLSEIGGTSVHTFSGMALKKPYEYEIDGTAEHGIELTFVGKLNNQCAPGDVLYAVTTAAGA